MDWFEYLLNSGGLFIISMLIWIRIGRIPDRFIDEAEENDV